MQANQTASISSRLQSFVWQHILLLASLFVMTFGVVLCVRSQMGSSVISACPLAFTMAGEQGIIPQLSLGMWTNLLNALLVAGQIVVLGRRFRPVQLLQLVIGVVFGAMIDINMVLTDGIASDSLAGRALIQVAGCTALAVGIAFELRCGSVTMPGEGLPAAIAKTTGASFANIKIMVDISLVVLSVAASYLFFGSWQWAIVGPGTLFAMLYVGFAVKIVSRRLQWFDRLMLYRPGLRRHIYGLARYLAAIRRQD